MSIVCFGEVLIDFLNIKDNLFEANPGGAPANVAAAISKFGGKSFLISQVGNDMFGKMILQTLSNYNVDISCVNVTNEYFTTLAFVKLNQKGERSFSFARKHGADVYVKKDNINLEIVKNAEIFHFGSLSMTHPENKDVTFYLLEVARKSGAVISYDPNYREPLWESRQQAVSTIFLPIEKGYVDILKMSEEEVLLYAKSAEEFYEMVKDKVKLLLVTLGEKGSKFFYKEESVMVETIDVDSVDTTGCGDCFVGMTLFEISKYLPFENIDKSLLYNIVKKANIAGALCATKKGAIPAIPEYSEVLARL